MALGNVIMTSRHGSLQLKDGTGTPLVLDVRFDRGDLSVSGLSPDMAEIITFQARHVHIGHALGAPTYPTLSFSLFVTEFSETAEGTLQDFLHGTAGTPYASRVSVADNFDGFACDIVFNADTTGDGSADRTLVFHGCVVTEYQFGEADEGMNLTVNATCYGDDSTNKYITGDLDIAMAT